MGNSNDKAKAPAKPKPAQKAPTLRKRVGQEAQVQGAGTQTPKGSAPKQTSEARAKELQEESLDPTTYITIRDGGSFQLKAGFDKPDGTSEPEWTLEFTAGLCEATPEAVDAVEQIIAGTWSDRRVPARVFQENARMVGLGVQKFGLEQAPMPTWETLEDAQVVPVALAAGVLGTPDSLKRAIRYEKQSNDRSPQRNPRKRIINQLEAQLALVSAHDEPALSVPVVNQQQGGNVVGTAGIASAPGLGVPGLQLGSSELG